MVVSYGLNLLCALLRTHLAPGISLLDFYDALCTKACSLCGEFGGFISLLTWKRCCFKCLREAPETQMQSRNAIGKRFHLTKIESDQLRSFKTLPGIYSMDEAIYKSRVAIVSVLQATLRRQKHVQLQSPPVSSEINQKFNFMGSCALPYYDKRTGEVEHGMSCAGCQLAVE